MSNPGEHWPRSSPGRGRFLQGGFSNAKAVFRYERSRATQAYISGVASRGFVRFHYVHVRNADRRIRSARSVAISAGQRSLLHRHVPSGRRAAIRPIAEMLSTIARARDSTFQVAQCLVESWECSRVCPMTTNEGTNQAPAVYDLLSQTNWSVR